LRKLVETIVIAGGNGKYPIIIKSIEENKRGKRQSIIVRIPHPPSEKALQDFVDYAVVLYDRHFSGEIEKQRESNNGNEIEKS